MVWRGFLGGNSGKAPICQCRRRKRRGLHPWVGKIYWRSAWPPTPVFMSGESAQTEEPDRPQTHGVTKSGSQLKHSMSSQTHRLKPQPPMWLSLETGLLRRGLILNTVIKFSSVQSLSHIQLFATHGMQHARPPCPSPTPGVYSNSCPLSWWCHPTILSSVVPFSSCPQIISASGSFQMSQLFTSGGQSTGVPASTSVLPKNIQDWFPLG